MCAYTVEPESGYVSQTIEELEHHYDGMLQIARIMRGGHELAINQQTIINAEDELLVIGSVDRINHFDNDHLTEVSHPDNLTVELMSVHLVLTAEDSKEIAEHLSAGSLLVENVTRRGKKLPQVDIRALEQGDILSITGPSESVRRAAHALGYIKDEGDASDIPFVALAIALGLLVGTLKLPRSSFTLLGSSGGALVIGMLCGWHYERFPRFGRMPDSTRWFLKSVGLNLFIAVKGLGTGESILRVFSAQGALILLAGILVTILPNFLALLFGRKVLKLDPVDLLGGAAGSGTCTAALNALSEETGSSIFAVGYAPAYAVGNILLTITGILLAALW